MQINLRKLLPLPIKELSHNDSEVWEADSITFHSGRSYLFYAPSGKGKTSLLSVIYGLRSDYEGVVEIDGSDIRLFGETEWSKTRKQQLSYIFQGLELFEEMTALENIRLKNRQKEYKSEQEIREMAGILEIDRFLERKAGILSFGQKQRVAIIRALCQPFDFLFADEIFSHLDEEISQKAYALIREECSRKKAGLLFTSLKIPREMDFDEKRRI